MSLTDEVTRLQDEKREKDRAYVAERRAKTLEDAAERFRAMFLEEPEAVDYYGREIENARAREWPDRVPVIITHDGIRFAYHNDDHGRPQLSVILTCEACGRDYLGEAIYATYPQGDPRAPAGYNVRKSALEHLAAALAPADWRAHECDENVLRPVRGAIKSAADKLGRPIDFSQLLA